jgi:hypothetical protein
MSARADDLEKAASRNVESTRSLLDQLLSDAKLYTTTDAYRELLDFAVRLRDFAPFNAMLLHIQKPGLTYAASAADWRDRFGRRPKPGARPLLILWPFGPVATVWDVLDTEGKALPDDAEAFPTRGDIDAKKLREIEERHPDRRRRRWRRACRLDPVGQPAERPERAIRLPSCRQSKSSSADTIRNLNATA